MISREDGEPITDGKRLAEGMFVPVGTYKGSGLAIVPFLHEGLVEDPVLGWCHHPAPVDGQDRHRLLGHPPHDPNGLVTLHQGVMIDEDERQFQPFDGGDFGLECPVGA